MWGDRERSLVKELSERMPEWFAERYPQTGEVETLDADLFERLVDDFGGLVGVIHVQCHETLAVQREDVMAPAAFAEKKTKDLEFAREMIRMVLAKHTDDEVRKVEARGVCLTLLRNSHMLLAKEVHEEYGVDFHFDREEESEDPPLFHAVRNDLNKPIVEWLVEECGQDVREVNDGMSVYEYAKSCGAGDMPEWFAERYPQTLE